MGGGKRREEEEYGTGVEVFEDDVGEVAGESERDSSEGVFEEREARGLGGEGTAGVRRDVPFDGCGVFGRESALHRREERKRRFDRLDSIERAGDVKQRKSERFGKKSDFSEEKRDAKDRRRARCGIGAGEDDDPMGGRRNRGGRGGRRRE